MYVYHNQFNEMKEEFYLEGNEWLGIGYRFFFEWILEKYKCYAEKPNWKHVDDSERIIKLVLTPIENISNENTIFLIMKLS